MEPRREIHRPRQLPPGRELLLPGRGRTFIREARSSPPRTTVVLLHGWAATADLNWNLAYPALSDHFDVVAIDQRGHGRGVRSRRRFTLEDCADDVAAMLAERRGSPAIMAGYSMGGPVAQLVWRRHPEVVSGLVLCATSDVFCQSGRDRLLFAAAGGAAAVARTRPTRLAGRAAAAALLRRRAVRAGLAVHLLGHDWPQVLEAGRAIGRFDSRRWLPAVDVPVAALTTLDDDVVPTRRQRAMAASLPVVAHRTVPGGHHACLHHRSGFVAALVECCRAVEGAARRAAGDGGARRRADGMGMRLAS